MKHKNIIALLVHGYMGTPFEMEPLAGPLEALGIQARMVTLPGHAASLKEFQKTNYADWLAHVEDEYTKARAGAEKVLLVGYSLGGSLALELAVRHKPDGVVTISSPVFPARAMPRQSRDWGLLLLPVLRFFVKEVPMRPGRPESREIAPWQGYEGVAFPPQLYSLYKGVTHTGKRLRNVSCPLLVVHDLRDRLVNAENALGIARGVSSEQLELRFTAVRENVTSHHTITTHRECREQVAGFASDFARRLMEQWAGE
ncbi:alpha/beta fold hydrolase [Desulfovibrio sp. OttesenSCG-928-C06]|nr:alpha/beta fold hydrolase [Desulfovibrio sp. OttesenSCG-928-C06]